MSMSGGWLPNIPLYEGGVLNADVPALLPVAIAGHPYLIDTKRYRRRTVPALRAAQDTESAPSEQSLNIEGIWPRFQNDWSLGAGEVHFDDQDRNITARRRFFASSGVDVWQRRELSLLNQMRNIRSSANTNLVSLATAGHLYVVDGSGVVYTADPSVASPSWTSMTGLSGTIYDLATDGTRIFVATSVGVYSATLGSAGASIFTTGTDATDPRQKIAYGNGRLIAGSDHVLEEIDSTGARVTLHTHFDTSFRWTAIGFSQRALYAAGKAGTTTDFLRFTVDPADGSLVPQGPAAHLPSGETVNVIVGYVGVVVIGTSRGLRTADVAADGSLDYRRVIEVGTVADIVAEGDYVWFTWNDATLGAGTGRAYLGAFTEDRVPAYARDVSTAESAVPLSVARFGNRTYLTVSGEGVFGEYAELVTEGWVTTGWIDYGTWFSKNWLNLDMRHASLAGTIEVSLINDVGVETTFGDSSAAGSDRPGEVISFNQARLERAKLKLTLTRKDADEGPTLYHWVLSVSPNPPRSEEIILPVIFHIEVASSDHQQAIAQLLRQEFAHIRTLVEDGQVVIYQEGEQGELVKVKDYELEGYKWSGDGTVTPWVMEGTLLVVMQTQ